MPFSLSMRPKCLFLLCALLQLGNSYVLVRNQTDEFLPPLDLVKSNGVDEYDNITVGAEFKRYRNAAVAADAPLCATIAKNILRKSGAKIGDATIAGLVCMGAIHPQSSGIGGGFIAVYYDKGRQVSWTLNARERSASAVTDNMFDEAPTEGGKAVAVPGEIKGYMELYKYLGGGVPWADLFEPTAQILERGFKVDEHLQRAFRIYEQKILNERTLRDIFVNPNTGRCWKLGETIKHPALAKTLRYIGKNGGEAFYDPQNNLNKAMINDLEKYDALITAEDFENYRAKWDYGITVDVEGGYKMHTPGPPASGAMLAFVMRILGNYKANLKKNDVRSLHLVVEALKHAYGRRERFGDPTTDDQQRSNVENAVKDLTESKSYLNNVLKKIRSTSTSNDADYYQDEPRSSEDDGTATFSIVDEQGNAISVTTTINRYFGAGFRSTQTGVIFNNQMADFSYNRQSSSANIVAGNKTPLSSACPVIFQKQGNVVLNTGAAGGIKIISVVSFMSVNSLWLGYSLDEAIENKRIHHMLEPMAIEAERGFDQSLLDGLRRYGHEIQSTDKTVVVGISRATDGTLYAASDSRKPGSVDGY